MSVSVMPTTPVLLLVLLLVVRRILLSRHDVGVQVQNLQAQRVRDLVLLLVLMHRRCCRILPVLPTKTARQPPDRQRQ
jgi:hypothetical protein